MERFKIFLLTVAVSVQVTSQDSTTEAPLQIPKPKITVNLDHGVLYNTETVTLRCEVFKGPEGLQYDWYKDSKVLNQHELSITASGSGNYQCKAKKGATESEKSDSHPLTVNDPPVPQIKSDWTDAYPGEKVSLQCVITDVSNSWTYMWFKGSEKVVSDGETLTLSVKSSDAGEYACKAELQDRKVTTTQSKPYSLKVLALPQPNVSISPQWGSFYQTEKVSLKCSVSEDPNKWDYEWFRNGTPLLKDKDFSFSGDTLSISSATAAHSGEYTCRGRHQTRTPVTTRQAEAVQLQILDNTPKPDIRKQQWFEPFYTDERVQLDCQMSGSGWKYQWFKGSNSLNPNSRLSIDSLSVTDTGDYYCKVQRGDFSVNSEPLRVRVQTLPQPNVSISPQWGSFYKTEKVSLKCSVNEDLNKWDYEWFRNGNQLLQDKDFSFSGDTLSISSATAAHSGEYTCRGRHQTRTPVTSVSAAVPLRVQDNTPKPDIRKQQWFEPFYTKERVQLDCQMSGSGWKYQWFKGLNSLNPNSRLSIDSLSVTDTGDYYCKVQRGDFSVNSEPLRVRVQNPPVPQIKSDWTEAFPSENVSLQCVITEVSNSWTYMWFKGSDKVVSDGKTSMKGNTLTLSVKSSDNGEYACQAELQDRKVTTTKSKQYSLKVHGSKPTFILEQDPPYPEIYKEEQVKLKCSIKETTSQWEYHWKKDSKQEKGPLYSISSAALSDGGSYTCEVGRRGNTFSQSTTLTIKVAPKPDIRKHPSFDFFYTDERVQLNCHMSGPGWKYHWYKNSNPLITDSNHTINIESLTDTGDYHCKPQRGDFSVHSETLQVRVQARPPALLHLETELGDIMSGDMTLRCNVTDGRQWNYTWFMDGEQLNTSSDVLKVTGNDETIRSEFKCKGINTVRPLYSALSDGFIANNILFKRKILLAISGCLVCCIFILIIGCIVLKVTRKPEVKEKTQEDLFFSMTDSKNNTTSPMKEYMDRRPSELIEYQEKEELITDRASAVHEDCVIKDEDTPASETNGLVSFKGH